jgi:hypothetical protein
VKTLRASLYVERGDERVLVDLRGTLHRPDREAGQRGWRVELESATDPAGAPVDLSEDELEAAYDRLFDSLVE